MDYPVPYRRKEAPVNALEIRHIAQISVTARDVARAAAFYRDTLGLRHLFDAGPLSFLECGGTRLMISRPEAPEFDHPSSILYLDVADIAGAHATLVSRGVAFEGEPHVVAPLAASDLWMAFFRDSEGNLLALHSEVPR